MILSPLLHLNAVTEGAFMSAIIFGAVATIINEFNEEEAHYLKFMLSLSQRMARKQLL